MIVVLSGCGTVDWMELSTDTASTVCAIVVPSA